MAEFVLISTIVNFMFALVWSTSTFLNVSIKTWFSVMTVAGMYLMFGPSNIIAQLAK